MQEIVFGFPVNPYQAGDEIAVFFLPNSVFYPLSPQKTHKQTDKQTKQQKPQTKQLNQSLRFLSR